ncbi:putative ribosomal RNA methyltransferase [Cercophora samala]|uniref:rRNA methyltransferase 2, mitochondrial n=1 Tax=Cercophora samala TaxID=330535 RepID=A0AA40DB92_9PEZI|nr:putative ribosomal RNA methyltransferase [Cercophora samala]
MSSSCLRAPLRLTTRPVNRTLSLPPSSSCLRTPFNPSTPSPHPQPPQSRPASSSKNWKARQANDHFALAAKAQGLRSRAAFKLLEIQEKYGVFQRRMGQIVVDLGYAPGSWSQVALSATSPNGTVIGIDLLPAQPPKGVSTIQGNFLSKGVQEMCKSFVLEADKKRRENAERAEERRREGRAGERNGAAEEGEGEAVERSSYIDLERRAVAEEEELGKEEEKLNMRVVDVVLSDMSEPWPQTHGFRINSISNPYLNLNRLMNTSGIALKDHVGSMNLCKAALCFASQTLKPKGHFICKYYQGDGDSEFEKVLKKMFNKVHREKPESSRRESREAFFVALRRREDVRVEHEDGMFKVYEKDVLSLGIL